MFGKRPGRVGDSPIIGAGAWADGHAAKSFSTETGLPLQTSITRDGPALYAGDDAGRVLRWAALP